MSLTIMVISIANIKDYVLSIVQYVFENKGEYDCPSIKM